MISGNLSHRYARALLAIGIDSGKFDEFGAQLHECTELLRDHHSLRLTLENPSYPKARRRAVVSQLADRLALDPTVRNFLYLLIDRSRICLLDDIARQYRDLADEHAGRLQAEITTSRKISDAAMQRLKQALEHKTHRKIVLRTRIDASLIAGTVSRIGSIVYDGSMRSRLDNIRNALLSSRT